MTPAEFRHWLQGFRDAGGTNIDVILAKAREIETEVKLIPSSPARPLPITPWYPQPWSPYTAPNTGDPSGPPWIITCSSIASGASIQDDHWPAWPSRAQ